MASRSAIRLAIEKGSRQVGLGLIVSFNSPWSRAARADSSGAGVADLDAFRSIERWEVRAGANLENLECCRPPARFRGVADVTMTAPLTIPIVGRTDITVPADVTAVVLAVTGVTTHAGQLIVYSGRFGFHGVIWVRSDQSGLPA